MLQNNIQKIFFFGLFLSIGFLSLGNHKAFAALSVSTQTTSDVSFYTATGNGTISSLDDTLPITEHGHVWSKDPNPELGPASTPIAQWKMNDNAGNTTVVDSVGGNNGTAARNTSLMTTPGKVNGALNFNGSSDSISIPAGVTLAGKSKFTLSLWINPSVYPNSGLEKPIYYESTSNSAYTRVGLVLDSNGKIMLGGRDSSQDPTGAYQVFVQGNGVIPLNTWTHITASFDSDADVFTLYKNGILDANSTTNRSALGSSVSAIRKIGTYPNQFFNGSIDDVRIYNTALSASEIAQIYNSGNGTEGSSKTQLGPRSTTGTFTSSLTGLDFLTTYHTRSYAVLSNGSEVYGEDDTFTTLIAPSETRTWTGALSSSWTTPGNWAEGSVPRYIDNVVINAGTNQPTLDVNGGTITIQSLTLGGGASTSTLTLSYGSPTNKFIVTGNVTILDKGYLTHTANTTTAAGEVHRLFMDIGGNLDVQTGGQINADGKGYQAGNGPGYCATNGYYSGSYGGQGDGGVCPTYGSLIDPVNLGSGGWGGVGGGAVILTISGGSMINGMISASAISSGDMRSSGGTINISSNTIAGSFFMKTNGGGSPYYGGGGGRIAVKLISGNDFGSITMQAYGGLTGGAAGTIYTETADQGSGNGTVIIDNNNITSSRFATIPSTQTWTIKNLVLRNKGQISVPTGTTLNLTNATITNDGLGTSGINVNGGTLTNTGLSINGIYLTLTAPQTINGNLSLGGGSTTSILTVSNGSPTNKFTVTGNVTITNNGYLTHTANTTAETHRLFMDVGGNLDVQVGGQINVDGKGYSAGPGSGLGFWGVRQASYGGMAYDLNLTYGSIFNPLDLGSGPSYCGAIKGGGSVIFTVTEEIVINGLISANGAKDSCGGGSGGTINILSKIFSGSGAISSNGGGISYGGAGGGRIAVKLTSGNDFGLVIMQAFGGGNSSNDNGAAGTIYTQTSLQGMGNGTITIDNNNVINTARNQTLIPQDNFTNNSLSLGNIIVKNKGLLAIPTGTTLNTTGDITIGTLNSSTDTSHIVANGTGTLISTNLTIHGVSGTGASINTNTKGYTPTLGTGAGTTGSLGYGSGGTYGGRGGNSSDGATSPNTYGNDFVPEDLGSGGGKSTGGTGGGDIRIRTNNNLNLYGTISSNGSAGLTNGGGGSGGSINILYAKNFTINGGKLQANGGAGQGGGGGGGGGRIAYAYENKTFTNQTIQTLGGTKGATAPATDGSAGSLKSGYLAGSLISSAFDSSSDANVMGTIEWKENEILPANTTVTISLKTAGTKENLSSSPWTQLAQSTASSLTSGCTKNGINVICSLSSIPNTLRDTIGDRFFQYKVDLSSPDLLSQPQVDDVSVSYVVNAPPEIESVSASQSTPNDTITFTYSIQDIDTQTGTYTPNYITPTFEYSLDDGSSWHTISSSFFTYNSAPFGGDISDQNADTIMENKVTDTYKTYSINWNAQQQLGLNTQTNNVRIRLTITDNEAANNNKFLVSDPFGIDTRPLTSITVSQSYQEATLGQVLISYDYEIQPTIQNNTTLTLEYFNGSTWIEAVSVTGDIGLNVSTGNKSLVWIPKTDIPEHFSSTSRVRLIASYQVASYTMTSVNYTLDTKTPTNPSLLVDASTQDLTIPSTTSVLTLGVSDDSPTQMKISLDENLTNSPWEPFNATVTIKLETDPDIVYTRFKDQYGNETQTIHTTTPETPTRVISQDTSNMLLTPPEYRAFVGFKTIEEPPTGFGNYKLYRSDDATTYTLQNIITSRTTNFLTDATPQPDILYTYKAKTTDTPGNVSFFSQTVTMKANGIQDFGEGGGGSDQTPPVLQNVTVESKDTTTVTITWETDELSDSRVEYATTPNTYTKQTGVSTYADTQAQSGLHRVTLTNLTPNTPYFFRVASTDPQGNTGVNDNNGNGYEVTTNPGPSISGVAVSSASNTQATIFWNTNVPADSVLHYSENKNGSLIDPITLSGSSVLTKNHQVTLDALTQGTTYYFYVTSTDSQGNIANDNNGGNYFQFSTTLDETPPTITNLQTSLISNDKAVITANTDEEASFLLQYRKKGSLTFTQTEQGTTYDRSHYRVLDTLTPDTEYEYQVSVKDINQNESQSDIQTMKTTLDPEYNHAPLSKIHTISDPPKVLTDQKAVITFQTDQAANCILEYGTQSRNYQEVPQTEATGIYDTLHSLHLGGLIFNTTYFYKLLCEDNLGTLIESEEKSFTTKLKQVDSGSEQAESTPPSISGVKVKDITGESAVVSWETDEVSNSQVRYGTTKETLQFGGDSLVNFDPTKYTTSHSVTLRGLIPSTKYFFSTGSSDTAGNIGTSSQQTFQTQSPSSISSIKASSKQIGETTITWKTSTPTTSIVEYGNTENYGQTRKSEELKKDHEIIINNLLENSTYHFRVKGEDESKNLFSSSDSTFEPKSPPQIKEIKIEVLSDREAKVNFLTDTLTDSLVTYKNKNKEEDQKSEGNPSLLQTHSLTLKELTPGENYVLTVRVRDDMGNETLSDEIEFTMQKDETSPTVERVSTDSALSQNGKVQMIINWQTDEDASSSLIYKEGRAGEEKTVNVSSSPTKNHIIVLTSWKPGTLYSYKVIVKDLSGNETITKDYITLTPQTKESVVELIIKNFKEIFAWTGG
ncbi:MAG: fibronectin type III domain-containing protein [Candidatus Moraniibacteriota bacterium]|nr:MAG: fibronectin type III domain-containing protein [Candidatus Moranbacteria bacterium]